METLDMLQKMWPGPEPVDTPPPKNDETQPMKRRNETPPHDATAGCWWRWWWGWRWGWGGGGGWGCARVLCEGACVVHAIASQSTLGDLGGKPVCEPVCGGGVGRRPCGRRETVCELCVFWWCVAGAGRVLVSDCHLCSELLVQRKVGSRHWGPPVVGERESNVIPPTMPVEGGLWLMCLRRNAQ